MSVRAEWRGNLQALKKLYKSPAARTHLDECRTSGEWRYNHVGRKLFTSLLVFYSGGSLPSEPSLLVKKQPDNKTNVPASGEQRRELEGDISPKSHSEELAFLEYRREAFICLDQAAKWLKANINYI